MARSHLSLETDKYEIFIDNSINEDLLDEKQKSTASSWVTTLNHSIDLSNLIYLKSTIAHLAVSQLSIDNLPLCFSELEHIKVTVNIPNKLGCCNQFYDDIAIKDLNNTPHIINIEDFTTTFPEDAISYLNEKVSANVTSFLLTTMLKVILDTHIFINNDLEGLSVKDVKLVIRYLDCILFSRHILHQYLSAQARLDDDGALNPLITFQCKDNISERTEQKIIAESKVLRDIHMRPKNMEGNSLNLEIFHGIDLQSSYDQEAGPKQLIESEARKWLTDSEIVELTDPSNANSPLTADSLNELLSFINANKGIINQALKVRQIFTLLSNRLSNRDKKQPSQLFHDNLVALFMKKNCPRLRCELNPELFLLNDGTFVKIEFPLQISYILGTKNGSNLTIGPIVNEPEINAAQKPPKLTNTITKSYQTTFSSIRPIPRILYIATDLISSQRRDLWLRNTQFESCHLIHSHIIDESTISSRMISKTNEDEIFHKISNLKSLLNQFRIFILDENFRMVIFPQKTYTRIAFTIKPCINDT